MEAAPAKPVITIRIDHYGYKPNVLAMAVDEAGKVIASHVCSNASWVEHDMGLTSDWHHVDYEQRYPQGYELRYDPS